MGFSEDAAEPGAEPSSLTPHPVGPPSRTHRSSRRTPSGGCQASSQEALRPAGAQGSEAWGWTPGHVRPTWGTPGTPDHP